MRYLRFRPVQGILAALVVIQFIGAILFPIPAGAESEHEILVITAPPYRDASLLAEKLRATGASTEVVKLTGSFACAVKQLRVVGAEYEHREFDVVAVGGAALPLRWVLEEEDAAMVGLREVVFLAAPNRGSVGAEAIYSQRLAVEAERYRLDRAMYRREGTPEWARPEYSCLISYLAHRSRNLFEPLYHNYLVTDRMSLAPAQFETAAGYMSWLADNYGGRLQPYLADTDTPVQGQGTLAELDGSDPGRVLCWGYVDLVAADLTRFTYFSTLPASRALSDNIMEDVGLTGDWRSMIVDFVTRRAVRFLREYIAPQAYRAGRWQGLDWFQRQTDLSDSILLYQLPEQVSIPGRSGQIHVPVNHLLRHLNASPSVPPSGIVVLEAPNWWQMVDGSVGPNDWWTEVTAAAAPTAGNASREDIFVPVGGRPASDERAVGAVMNMLGLHSDEAVAVHPVWHWTARGLDVVMGLWARLRGAGAVSDSPERGDFFEMDEHAAEEALSPRPPLPSGEAREVAAEETAGDAISTASASTTTNAEIPSITAIYRNKSTTLKRERRLPHRTWVWDFGDGGSTMIEDPDNLRGTMEHTFEAPGQHRVTAHSASPDGTELREMQWDVTVPEAGHRAEFAYDTAAEIIPSISLNGPRKWVVGRYAEYSVDVQLEELPDEIENMEVVVYPGQEFRVTWERPGTFEVKAAANLRYSWRFADGSSRYFSVIYTESHPVEVLATGLHR